MTPRSWAGGLHRCHGAGYEAVRVEGFPALGIFEGVFDVGEYRHRGDAEGGRGLGVETQLIHAQAFDARHRGHGIAHCFSFHDEHRIDEIVDA